MKFITVDSLTLCLDGKERVFVDQAQVTSKVTETLSEAKQELIASEERAKDLAAQYADKVRALQHVNGSNGRLFQRIKDLEAKLAKYESEVPGRPPYKELWIRNRRQFDTITKLMATELRLRGKLWSLGLDGDL